MTDDDTQQSMVVTIGLNQLYEKLMEVQFGVRDIKNQLGELAHDSRDHEERLRTLESEDVKGQRKAIEAIRADIRTLSRTVWALSGGAAVVGVVGGWLLKSLGA